MNTQLTCAGIPAAWINGWLAGVGATVLDSRIRLHWSTDSNRAVLSALDVDPLEALVASWPSEQELSDLPIAERWHQAGVLRRKVDVEAFTTRVRAARSHAQSWALSSTMTDLRVDGNGEVAHAPFDPAGPGTIKWLHHRLMKVYRHTSDPSPERIGASLMGEAVRVHDNGLGFDQTRLGSQSDDSDRWTDPVVELLAFFGLAILPMRGRGSDGRQERFAPGDERQKGWHKPPDSRATRRFHWPAWGQPLDADGIDALMDLWNPTRRSQWPLVGVHAAWRTVAFRPQERADTTRALGAERL